MVDINTQIRHWLEGGREDWLAACSLIEHGHHRQGLFMAHLALEKLLKSKVCQRTGDLAPRMHNLVRLAELAEINLKAEQLDTLADMNDFNLEGRYPEEMAAPPTAPESKALMARTKEVIEWLTQK